VSIECLPTSLDQLRLRSQDIYLGLLPIQKSCRQDLLMYWSCGIDHLDRLTSPILQEIRIRFDLIIGSRQYLDIGIIENTVSSLDWETLGSVADRCSSLKILRLDNYAFKKCPSLEQQYLRAMDSIASRRLPSRRRYVLEVVSLR
jgi:hypothetical protein